MTLIGKYLTATATTAATTNATATVTFSVPANKVWLFNVIAISVNNTNNNITISADNNQIWETLTNVTTEQVIDLSTRYPRSLEASSSINIVVTTTENVAKTLTAKVWILEGP